MSSTVTEPWFVGPKRAAKADRIAHHLTALGVHADQAAHYDDTQRRAVETAAGVNKGSDTTWRSVVEMLAGSMMPGALCLTCGIGMPGALPGPRKPHGHDGDCTA